MLYTLMTTHSRLLVNHPPRCSPLRDASVFGAHSKTLALPLRCRAAVSTLIGISLTLSVFQCFTLHVYLLHCTMTNSCRCGSTTLCQVCEPFILKWFTTVYTCTAPLSLRGLLFSFRHETGCRSQALHGCGSTRTFRVCF